MQTLDFTAREVAVEVAAPRLRVLDSSVTA